MTDRWRELFDEARAEFGKHDKSRAEELISQAIQAAEQVSPQTRSYSDAQGSFALWYFSLERYADAEACQRRYIEAEQRLGVFDRELGNMLMMLAEIQQKQNKLSAARVTMETAIATFPQDELPDIAGAKQEYANLLEITGESTRAARERYEAMELTRRWDQIVAER